MKNKFKKENFKKMKGINRDLNNKEFKENKLILKSYPRKIYVETTRNCNNLCAMCCRVNIADKIIKYKPEFDMPFILFKKIADTLFPYAEFVDLRGFGESTIMKNFMDYVNYALKFNCELGLVTNLTVQNDDMWRELVKNDIIFDVSIDGATKETFEFIRRGAIFENVINNVKKLIEFANDYNKPIENFNFLVTVQKYNIKEIPKIIELANKLGIKRIKLAPVTLAVKDPNNLSYCQEKVKKYIPAAINLAKEKDIEVLLINSFGLKKMEKKEGFKIRKKCETPWSSIYIDYRGVVGPCNNLMPLVFKDVNFKNNDFKEIWNNINFLLFRSMVNTKYRTYLYDRCVWCSKNSFILT